ncbi:hypothetical protein LzC2_23110 [Planctomycetes bacterium LzC2]|uniref:LigA n=1 Tax=Alienimonas chondri TaxID=2681879 RepID=A0ABX1VDQ2_9PLAN|nr:hypothetical protein [Alienimonas chondri]
MVSGAADERRRRVQSRLHRAVAARPPHRRPTRRPAGRRIGAGRRRPRRGHRPARCGPQRLDGVLGVGARRPASHRRGAAAGSVPEPHRRAGSTGRTGRKGRDRPPGQRSSDRRPPQQGNRRRTQVPPVRRQAVAVSPRPVRHAAGPGRRPVARSVSQPRRRVAADGRARRRGAVSSAGTGDVAALAGTGARRALRGPERPAAGTGRRAGGQPGRRRPEQQEGGQTAV